MTQPNAAEAANQMHYDVVIVGGAIMGAAPPNG